MSFHKLLPSINEFNRHLILEELEKLKVREFLTLPLDKIKIYESDFLKRDEFIFENLYQIVMFERLMKEC